MPARQRMAATIAATGAITAIGLAGAQAATAQPTGPTAFLSQFSKLSTIASTVPGNGDVNPYGIFVVQQSTGRLQAGDVLISNFNDKANEQGTGKTIVEISPGGHRTLFASISASQLSGKCPGGVGLTTALEVLPGGWVIVGSTPSANGLAATAKAGCLIVLNNMGQVAETITGHGINGPWDSVAVETHHGVDLFVANVLNGTVAAKGKRVHKGTVVRLKFVPQAYGPPQLVSSTVVASGYAEQTNASAFVLGPTGLGVGDGDVLYVAETDTSRIIAVQHALTRPHSDGVGMQVTMGHNLVMPLGLAIAPNGDVLTVNGGNGKIVETTPAGAQIDSRFLDTSGSPKGAGALFGLAIAPGGDGVYYVDDAVNTLRLLH